MSEPILTRDEVLSLRAIDKKLLRTILVPDKHIQKFLELGLIKQGRLEYLLTDAGTKILEQQG